MKKPEDAADIIKQYEEIFHTKSKGIVSVAYHQEKVFSRFGGKEKLIKLISKYKVHKTTIIFKMNIFKLIDKHSKLMKSSVTLSCFQNYFKDIKVICKENSSELQ